jgi:hypothetical protein
MAVCLFAVATFSASAFAQGLNWEGQTGAVITPFAYTASAPASKFGKPEVAFHFLNAGNVIGNDYQFSVTEGICKRFEVGFTQSFSSAGNSSATLLGAVPQTSLFTGGYSAFHGKLTVIPENLMKTKWVPAIAVGAIGRIGDQRASFVVTNLEGQPSYSQTNADFYVVATKTVTQIKGLPIVLNFGEKVTNASIMGIAGNAGNAGSPLNTLSTDQRWQGRLFGAAAFVVKGPAKSALILGSEAVQQPKYVQGVGNLATIPTSMTYFVRIVPHMEGSPLQVDLACVQAAGKIAPGVDLNAKARFGMGMSYHF